MTREQIAYEKGYRVSKYGDLLNPKGGKIGCLNSAGYKNTVIRFNRFYKYSRIWKNYYKNKQ